MSIRNLVNSDELKEAVKLINNVKISSPPQLLLDIKTELAQANPNVKEIIDWINKDISLPAQVIKTVNSPLFGLEVEVNTIEHAFNLLGLEKFKNIVLLPAYHHALTQSIEGFERISEHSHRIGLITEIIANEIDTEDHGQFYLAGLFHDVGCLVLTLNYPDFPKLEEKNLLHPLTQTLWEKEKYGVTHASSGVLLAKKWGLSTTICNAIYLHHHLYATYRKEIDLAGVTMAATLQLADYLNCKALGVLDIEKSVEYGLFYNNSVAELMLEDDSLLHINEELDSLP